MYMYTSPVLSFPSILSSVYMHYLVTTCLFKGSLLEVSLGRLPLQLLTLNPVSERGRWRKGGGKREE